MQTAGSTGPVGQVGLEVVRAEWDERRPNLATSPLKEVVRHGFPAAGLSEQVNVWRRRNLRPLMRGVRRVAAARILNIPTVYGALWLNVERADGTIDDLGLASLRVVTTAGATKIVDFLRASDTTTGTTWKYHAIGTGSTAEAAGDTALVTEVETRGTGTQTNNGATVYRTVGTVTATTSRAIVEHGVLSASTVGTLLDRSVFTVVNLANGDSIQATYDLTISTGG